MVKTVLRQVMMVVTATTMRSLGSLLMQLQQLHDVNHKDAGGCDEERNRLKGSAAGDQPGYKP